MRSLLFFLTAISVIGLAFWAYRENYETQDAQARAEALQRDILDARQTLRILRAEWAYLNRPDRLRELADINFDSLGLLPLHAHQFGNIKEVAEPGAEPLIITNPVDVSNMEQFP